MKKTVVVVFLFQLVKRILKGRKETMIRIMIIIISKKEEMLNNGRGYARLPLKVSFKYPHVE